jgi:hypothetical protein
MFASINGPGDRYERSQHTLDPSELEVPAADFGPNRVSSQPHITPSFKELVAAKYDGSKKRGRGLGRPRKAVEIVRLLLEMATQNTGLGFTRLRDALNNPDDQIGRATVEGHPRSLPA